MSKSMFVLKIREDYSQDPSYSGSYQIATGMWNSSTFVSDILNSNGRSSSVQLVQDNNSIDAIVTSENPTHVFIEGLWVTPAKIRELLAIPRHANRVWVIRIHSEIPFLATEGVAMQWIAEYLDAGVIVSANAPRAHKDLKTLAARRIGAAQAENQVKYLPNCFPLPLEPQRPFDEDPDVLKISCFGAIRPLKNQVQQAIAAMKFAEYIGKPLEFHINDRTDAGGSGPAQNLRDLFINFGSNSMGIVNHVWEDRTTFLSSLRAMDLSLQVSMTETFNIVAADSISVDTPILTSNEVPWAYPMSANPQSSEDIFMKIKVVWKNRFFLTQHRNGLSTYARESERLWTSFIPQ